MDPFLWDLVKFGIPAIAVGCVIAALTPGFDGLTTAALGVTVGWLALIAALIRQRRRSS